MSRCLCFAFAATLVGSAASAQVLQGRFVDAGGDPIIAAMVTLSDGSGAQVAQVLSDSNGVYLLEGRDAGLHTLLIERVGFAPRRGAVVLSAGATGLSDTLRMSPVAIGDVSAGDVAGCTDQRVSDLWSEARKTLRAIALAEELGLVRVNGVRYMREMDGRSWAQLAVLREEAFRQTGVPAREPPPETPPGHWYAVTDSAHPLYFSATARALAADDFERDHCFTRITIDSDSARVGLNFEPRHGIAAVGIAGTLWLQQQTGRLRSVDYTYQAGSGATMVVASGTVEFSVPENGVPHVSRWTLRLPVTRIVREGGRSREVRTIVEDGALVFGIGQQPLSDPDNVFPALRGAYALDPVIVEAEARNIRRQIVSTPGTSRATVLSDWEIRYTVGTNAFDLINTLHPAWLRPNCPRLSGETKGVAIYVNGIKVDRGEYDFEEALKDVAIPDIAAVQKLNAIEAPMLFGNQAACGAILINLKRFEGT